MHICFITVEYPTEGKVQGGIGSVVQTIARALVLNGIKVSVVGVGAFDEDERVEDQGVGVYRIPSSSWKLGRFIQNTRLLLKKLEEIHQKEPIDVIEGSESTFAFFPRSFYAKKVIRMHGGHKFFAKSLGEKPAKWRSFQEKRSFDMADGLLAVSEYVGRTTKELLGLDASYSTIYNLIDVEKFYKADENKIIPKKIVFVGTVTEKKGVRQLVQAMPKIVEKFPDASLDVIGRDWFDPKTGESYIKYLKTFISDAMQKNINIIGVLPHDEIPERLESAEVCVYPSHMEAMPIAWLEALGMGKAVVASELGPGPEAIEEGKTGLLCNPYTPDDIAKKILYMFEHPDEAKKMGENSRKDVLTRFPVGKIMNENIEFYRSIAPDIEGRE